MVWDGNERRKTMDEQLKEVTERLIKLEVLQEQDIKEANEWRPRLCNKFDKMMDKFNSLPCDKRESRWESLQAQTKWLWIAVSFIMTVLTILVGKLLHG